MGKEKLVLVSKSSFIGKISLSLSLTHTNTQQPETKHISANFRADSMDFPWPRNKKFHKSANKSQKTDTKSVEMLLYGVAEKERKS